ncbi:zinc finger protein 845-like [Pectinophora gossypiella]|uniref:zinc finger protein 845-like n=1 Tax=Pectinophora gossypiella TaxID=13191 RepID=UPI00214E9B14|nr:zinc finger protein 845-like [Pectinophora gossypiella]
MSTKESLELKANIEVKPDRKDPTSFLPEEPMCYEIKKKKKKKKKKQEDDPFKDIEEKALFTERIILPEIESSLDPEVSIKVENIEVELDFNDFTNNGDLLVQPQSDDSQEPQVKIEPQNHEAVLLTFESIINDKPVIEINKNIVESSASHMCKICHLVFQSNKTLLMHQKRKHKIFRRSFIHVCDTCGMSYDQKNSLAAHIKRKHGPDANEDNEERVCEVCALVFKGMTRLRMHMRRKHGAFEDSFKHVCEDCGLAYDKYRSLIVHRQRKHLVVKKPVLDQWFSCPFCPKIFNKRETYARHVQRKHKISDDAVPQSTDEFFSSFKNEAGEITCKQCPLVFSSINFLKLHMRRKHNALKEDFRLKCRICNLSYDKIESLKRHVRRKHDQGSYCNVCNKQFGDRELYLNHSHVKIIKECSICGLIFSTQGGLAKHLRGTHKIESPKVAFCNICNEGFYDKRQLKPHLLRVHYKVSYTCRYCKKVFKAKESYRRHVLFKHPSKPNLPVELQTCDQCSETFKDEFELCKHVNVVHRDLKIKPLVKVEEDDNQFQCTKCKEMYPTWDQLRSHYEQNHFTQTTSQCQICGEIFPENELQKHIKQSHTKNEELQCRFCEFRTNVKVSMTQHMLRHKDATTLHCDFPGCRYKTFYVSAIEKHKRKHLDQGVRLHCSQCMFQTMNKYILKYHEEAHMTGKKRYVCDQCDYATTLPANLVQHKYKHSSEKRFKCEVCPFATKYNTSLRFHVKKKHCDLPT